MTRTPESADSPGAARQKLEEAEAEYRRALTEDYIARLIRDDAIVEAHRSGLSSREISELIGDIGQPNVVRARRRALTRRERVPQGMLSPADAVRASGLRPREFVSAVRDGRIVPVVLEAGVRAFKPEDVATLRPRPQKGTRRVAPSASG